MSDIDTVKRAIVDEIERQYRRDKSGPHRIYIADDGIGEDGCFMVEGCIDMNALARAVLKATLPLECRRHCDMIGGVAAVAKGPRAPEQPPE